MKLESELMKILAKADPGSPVETRAMAKCFDRVFVENALQSLYNDRRVGCCRVIRGDDVIELWWPAGAIRKNVGYRSKRK